MSTIYFNNMCHKTCQNLLYEVPNWYFENTIVRYLITEIIWKSGINQTPYIFNYKLVLKM